MLNNHLVSHVFQGFIHPRWWSVIAGFLNHQQYSQWQGFEAVCCDILGLEIQLVTKHFRYLKWSKGSVPAFLVPETLGELGSHPLSANWCIKQTNRKTLIPPWTKSYRQLGHVSRVQKTLTWNYPGKENKKTGFQNMDVKITVVHRFASISPLISTIEKIGCLESMFFINHECL